MKYLLDRPEVFVARLRSRWGIVTNPKAINRDNSGSTFIENLTIEELEEKIDGLIKEAGRFCNESDKNKKILKRFSKFTFIAYTDVDIQNNDTGYSDEEVKGLLKDYDKQYKRPLRNYLIEYYRLKHNPEINMEGYLLERLGFNPCGHCHDDEYKPGEYYDDSGEYYDDYRQDDENLRKMSNDGWNESYPDGYRSDDDGDSMYP